MPLTQVVPGIWSWSRFNDEKQMDFNGHVLLLDDARVAIIDPPQTGEAELSAISSLGPAAAIIITNRDHLRDAEHFRERFHAPIWTSTLDAPLVKVKVDRTISDGETLLERFAVIMLEKMKSPGEFAMHDPKTRSMIIGDAVIGKVPGKLNLLPTEKVPDPAGAKESLRKLLDYDFDNLIIGDGTSIVGSGKEKLADFLHAS